MPKIFIRAIKCEHNETPSEENVDLGKHSQIHFKEWNRIRIEILSVLVSWMS